MLPNEGNADAAASRTSVQARLRADASVASFISAILTERSLFRFHNGRDRPRNEFASLFSRVSVFVFGWAELTVLDKSPLMTGATCVTGTFEQAHSRR
jgi:hypothetical protein